MKFLKLTPLSLIACLTAAGQNWNSSGNNYTIGKLAIGSSGPFSYEVDIAGASPYLRLHSTSYTNNPSSLTRNGGIIFSQENGDKTAAVLFAVPPGYHVPGILLATKETWNSPGTQATDWYNRMYIHPNGNVGIGTMMPSSRLHVDGSLRLDGNTGLPGNALGGNSLNYVNKYNFKLTGSNNGFYISISNTSNERKVYFQSGHEDPNYAYGVGSICLNPFGGNVGIGTTTPTAMLTVGGDINSREVRVTVDAGSGPDYVFEKDYHLLPLNKLEAYINANRHLPEVPSAKEMEEDGLNLKEMNLLLLKKVEELTLYLIEQSKEVKAVRRNNEILKKENDNIKKEIDNLKSTKK